MCRIWSYIVMKFNVCEPEKAGGWGVGEEGVEDVFKQDACVRTGCRAWVKEWVMGETFQTKLLSVSRIHAYAQPKNRKEQIQNKISSAHLPIKFIFHAFHTIRQQLLFEALRYQSFCRQRHPFYEPTVCLRHADGLLGAETCGGPTQSSSVKVTLVVDLKFSCKVWALASLKFSCV